MRAVSTFLTALLVTAALATASGTQAEARDREWCSEDPIFTVLGATFRITTSINSPASAVTGIVYVVEVPGNAGNVRVTTPHGEALAAVTEVKISRTGPAYDADENSFRVRVTLTVSGPDGAKVIAQLDGPSVDPHAFNGRTGKPLNFKFDVTP